MEFLSQSWNIAQVVLGIGIVIFVHEAGHFLAARWCGVRVDVFSLGFGPKLFGWRRGATLYQVAAVPLGGYVKMAGEEFLGGDKQLPPDDLRAKSVGQRFLIYSGGVIMNVVFALVIFPIIFTIGVPFDRPLVGYVEPGSPAWLAGVQPGSEIVTVNGNKVIQGIDLVIEVALSPEGVDIELRDPGAAPDAPTRIVHVQPIYNEQSGRFEIGAGARAAVDPDHSLIVEADTPAAAAGLATGDRLVDVEGDLREAPLAERFERRLLAGEPFEVTVERPATEGGDAQRRTVLLTPVFEQLEDRLLGIRPVWNVVSGLREDPRLDQLGLMVGDRILTAQGRFISSNHELARALTLDAGPLALRIDRNGRELELSGPAVDRSSGWALAQAIALDYDPESGRVALSPGSAALAAGLQDGDAILQIDGRGIEGWDEIRDRTGHAAETGSQLALRILRHGPEGATISTIHATPEAIERPAIGAHLATARYVYRSANFAAAIVDGARSSWKFMTDAWLTLKRIVRGQVSSRQNLGGIITIGVVSHSAATVGVTYLLFFLCLLSVNLAFLNVLPIPVLDGGHLFFLIVEKIKGSPVSERVLSYSQLVGLVMIVSLMIYVTFNDVMRWFFER